MWLRIIEEFKGKSFFLEDKWDNSVNMKLNADASNIGYGGIFGKRWFYGEWPPSWALYHITVKELFPAVLALETWGYLIANKCIDFYTDNEAVSEVINKQSSRDETIMKLLRCLVLCFHRHNILFRATHLPGKFNILPALLSRLQIDQFPERAPDMNSQPEVMNIVNWDL